MRRQNVGDHLPPELLFNIHILLEPKDLIRCMCVSKAWYTSIRDPRFIKLHHHHHQRSIKTIILLNPTQHSDHPSDVVSLTLHDDGTFGTAVEVAPQPLEPPSSIVGCSNGLVCICNVEKTEFALWNPSIRRSKKIPFAGYEQPPPGEMSERKDVHYRYGFGYDSANDDYKLVKIAHFHGKNSNWAGVYVFSLKSNTWKMIESIPCNAFLLDLDYAVCLNSALSWKIDAGHRCEILSLDLASEKYSVSPFPVDGSDNFLGVVGTYLCVYNRNWDNARLRHDVWIMEEVEVTNTKSWTLLFCVEELSVGYIRPLLFAKDGEVLLEIDDDQLVWFDLETESAEEVEIHDLLPDIFEATICEGMGSLRLLLDGDPVTDDHHLN